MRIQTKEASITANLGNVQTTGMSISASGMAHIMSVLTNLYQDPNLATYREVLTNAFDAHIAAGQTNPVQVTLPTSYSPIFMVKDEGVGLNAADFTNIYFVYGESTKRSSDNEAGGFGLGCKAPLTICSQFTVVGIKDGIKTTALVSRSEDGSNAGHIVSEVATTEPNGVTVSIPVENVRDFVAKAENHNRFVNPDLLIVNGRKPESALADTKLMSVKHTVDSPLLGEQVLDLKINYSLTQLNYYSSAETYVLMGDVPYRVDSHEITNSFNRVADWASKKIVNCTKYITVPIGSVDLTPSREGLRHTSRTNNILDAALEAFYKNIEAEAQAEIDAEDDRLKALELVESWRGLLGTRPLWRGKDIPVQIALPEYAIDTGIGKSRRYDCVERYSYDNKNDYGNIYEVHVKKEYIFVSGVKTEELKKTAKFIGSYLKGIGQNVGSFIFFEDPTNFLKNEWLKDNPNMSLLTADDLTAVAKKWNKEERARKKAEGPKTPVVKPKMKYPVLDVKTLVLTETEYDQIPAGTPYLVKNDMHQYNTGRDFINEFFTQTYVSASTSAKRFNAMKQALPAITDADQIIILNGSRSPKALLDRVPTTYNILDDYVKKHDELVAEFTDDIKQKVALENHGTISSIRDRLVDHEGDLRSTIPLSDKALESMILKKGDYSVVAKINEFNQATSTMYFVNNYKKINIPTRASNDTIQMKYPMISALYTSVDADHIVLYLNAVHDHLVAKSKKVLDGLAKTA